MSGEAIRTMQNWLNRIRVNFPTIPEITNVSGIYGPQTEAAVRAFQAIPSLSSVAPNGVVDRTTWNNISRAYSAVKRLGELTSEGIIVGIGRTPPTETIRQGSRGTLVGQAQYVMNFIAEFYPSVPMVAQDFNFGANFTAAVREFQRLFGLNPDGASVIIGLSQRKRVASRLSPIFLPFSNEKKVGLGQPKPKRLRSLKFRTGGGQAP